MASLRVPERYLGGLAKLLKLPDEEAERLFSSLEQLPIAKAPRSAVKGKVAALSTIPKSDVESITDAIMSLFAIWNYAFKSPSDLANEIVEAINENPSEELEFSDDVRGKIKPRLIKIFSMPAIAASVKAEARRFDYDKVFSTSTVSSDIRPIFGSDPKEPPRVAVVTHMLNIHYVHEGDHKEFYVAMDDVDIKALKEQLERAVLKSDNLKSVLADAKLEYLAPE